MKRKLFGKTIKHAFLAIPASALMLGVSQAQTTIGINFAGGSYGYQGVYQGISYLQYFTGFPVTATAFGVSPSNWLTTTTAPTGTVGDTSSTGYYPFSSTANGSLTAGTSNNINVSWTSGDCWGTHIGMAAAADNGSGYLSPPPGNDEVLWGMLDNTGWSINLSGLNASFPNGYVIQFIGVSKVTTNSQVSISDGTTTSWLHFSSLYSVGSGTKNTATPVGTLVTPVFTSDALAISNPSRSVSSTTNCAVSGFIITDQPVVSQPPVNTISDLGKSFILSAGAIGIPPLSYQWQLNGTNLPGATFASYTNASATLAAGGNYDVIVTNLYGVATSVAATVTINQAATILSSLPAAMTNFSTMNANFYATVGGVPPLSYYWFKNSNLLGATNAALTLTDLQTTDIGNYQFIVSNAFGTATSSVVNLSVIPSLPPYEGFNYAAGDLNGQAGGTGGWTNGWSQETGYNGGNAVISTITPWRGSLSELTSTGGGLLLSASGAADYEDIRSLATTIGGNGYGTIYLSFVMQATNNSWSGIELVKDSTASLFLGECWQGSKWGWGARGGPDAVSTIAPATYSLLVYRFDYTPTNVLVKLYVNPASMTAEPATATVSGSETAVAFNKIRIVSHGYITGNAGPDGVLDELRVGGTWASVTPYNIRTDAPFSLQMVLGGVVQDSKPAGTLHQGLNYKTIWQPSVTDFNSVTRTGVEQFIMTNSSQITIPTDPDLQSTTGTISFWMNYNIAADGFALPGPGSESAMLFDWRTTSGTIIALNASGGIQFQATAGARFAGVSTVLPDGNWHHVAVTYDQSSNGVVAIYIDGVLDTQANNPNTWTWPTNGDIELGHSRDAYWKIYNGQMDDFRIYSRVLTAGEITTIGTATTSDQLVDTSALKVRYNFDADSTTFGKSVVWPYGTLQSSSSLGSDAAWTSLTNAISPQPIIISPTVPALFYRLTGTP